VTEPLPQPKEEGSTPKGVATRAAPEGAPSKDPAQLPPDAAAEKSSLAWPLVTACLLLFTFLTFPIAPVENHPDASLSAVLHYAQEHQIQYGTELIYTYGPLGFLIFPHYTQHTAPFRMTVDVVLCLSVAAGLCLLAWRLSLVWRWLLLLVFIWVAANIRPGTDFVLETGLLSWGLLCFVSSGRRLICSGCMFAAFAAFCALAKNSLLFVATAGVVLAALDAGVRERRVAFGMIGTFVGVFTAGWLLSGQHLGNVGAFVVNSLTVIQGYNAALGMEGLQTVMWAGMIIILLSVVVLVLRSVTAFDTKQRHVLWRRLFLLAFVALIASASWKHGFVRGDAYHVVLCLGLVPVLLLGLETLSPGSMVSSKPFPARRRILHWCARSLGLSACILSVAVLQGFYFSTFSESMTQPLRSLRASVHRVIHPHEFWRELDGAVNALRAESQLPDLRRIIGKEPVDVFGQGQVYAMYNGLNYRPRPVYQSYAACSARLMRFNEDHFFSESAPPYYLFELNAIDRKFPSLEDAWLLRDLLVNCELVASENKFLLLRRTSSLSPKMKMVGEGTVRPGERIDLTGYGEADLWLEITLSPTLAGRARQLVYRPSTLRLAAWSESGKLLYRHQAAASMLSAGFIASPLLLRTEDILDLFQTNSLPRPRAYSVELAQHDPFWQQSIQFCVYRIESRLSRTPASTPDAANLKSQVRDPGSVPNAVKTNPLKSEIGNLKSGEEPPSNLAKTRFSDAARRAADLTVFRDPRWRPGEEPPGTIREMFSYAVFLLAPVAAAYGLVAFARRQKKTSRPIRWPYLVLGNALVFILFVSLLLLAVETYFRFIYDTTDSLGYTRVCQRWVQRHWHVNAAGCRDDVEYSPALSPGKRRISFLGDSFTAGHGVKDVRDRFPNRLRRAHPETEIHVLANVGLDTGSEIILLNRLLARGYQLDQVVLVYCLNDIGDLAGEQSAAYDQMLAGLGRGGWLTRNSYALNLLYHRYRAGKNPNARSYFGYVRDAYRGAAWDRQKQRLKELRDLVESHGGRFAVITFPFLDAVGSNYPYQLVHQQLDQLWRELQVLHLDLLPIYQDLPASSLVVNPYDGHPNERANRLAAEAVEKFLVGAGKLQTGAQLR
jgi:lysophospholipase L1-like esterase